MAKKRKTRQQKIAADLRRSRKESSFLPSYHTYVQSSNDISSRITLVPSSADEYLFIRSDLFKTASITGIIVLVELMIFFG